MEKKKRLIILSGIILLPIFLLVYQISYNLNKAKNDIEADKPILSDLPTNDVPTSSEDTNDDITENFDSTNLLDVSKSISIESYKSTLTTYQYQVQAGDTVSRILRNYEDTCNYKTGIKYLKLLNPYLDLNNLEIDSILNLPTDAFTNGRLYKVIKGDTWYDLSKSNYPGYDTDDIIDFLISINDLPSSKLPSGENIFLPNL
ncbi:LysM peptidoglycan-binding domain-containing protein [Clostridium sp. AL.422]|uniref:LysM peptidoglycan-binding domain-containing protein n=1 Tax=Clostridium TaxID=1485 RepID=UPI00293DCD92|nr:MULTISPECIES: LysM peptidoglycan-binding domain-containing protein [unclassified Clostridium]MDV4150886.1 LysM peptidoglycan-binding domain-containing protein [Clostridium sp. AL.422]